VTFHNRMPRAAFPLFVGKADEAWCHECRKVPSLSTASGAMMTCGCGALAVELPRPGVAPFWADVIPQTARYVLVRTMTAGWFPIVYDPVFGISNIHVDGTKWPDPNGPTFPISEATGWLAVRSIIDS